uniref:Uncharacterized protein n=1 Tax=Anguilla anguilla TaxID=7936 RepID=A0A0E9XSY7_ANGAN
MALSLLIKHDSACPYAPVYIGVRALQLCPRYLYIFQYIYINTSFGHCGIIYFRLFWACTQMRKCIL